MKIPAGIAVWMCAVFALFCFCYALTGLISLGDIADEVERDAARGYVWYWMFLAVVAVVFGVLSWMISTGKLGDPE